MTCVIGAVDRKNRVWMAADKRMSEHEHSLCFPTPRSKLLSFGRNAPIIGAAGDSYAIALLFSEIDQGSAPAVETSFLIQYVAGVFSSFLQTVLKAYRIKFKKPDEGVELLLGFNGELVAIGIDYEGITFDEVGPGYAIGSGSAAGMAAFCLAEQYVSNSTDQQLRVALEAVSKFNPYVDNNIDIIHE